MPFKSKAQARYFAWAEEHGELPKGTFKKWLKHTPGKLKNLPEHVSSGKKKKKRKRKSHTKEAYKVKATSNTERYIENVLKSIPHTTKKVKRMLNEQDVNRIMQRIKNDPYLKEEERRQLAKGFQKALKYSHPKSNLRNYFLGSLAGMALGYYTSREMAKKNVSPWMRKLIQSLSTVAGGVGGWYMANEKSYPKMLTKESSISAAKLLGEILEKGKNVFGGLAGKISKLPGKALNFGKGAGAWALYTLFPFALYSAGQITSAIPPTLSVYTQAAYKELPYLLAAGGFATGAVSRYLSAKDKEKDYAHEEKMKHVKEQIKELREELGLLSDEEFSRWLEEHGLEAPAEIL